MLGGLPGPLPLSGVPSQPGGLLLRQHRKAGVRGEREHLRERVSGRVLKRKGVLLFALAFYLLDFFNVWEVG